MQMSRHDDTESSQPTQWIPLHQRLELDLAPGYPLDLSLENNRKRQKYTISEL